MRKEKRYIFKEREEEKKVFFDKEGRKYFDR